MSSQKFTHRGGTTSVQSAMSLAALIENTDVERLHIAIVTPDLLGPVQNGGIGTACSYLAWALAEGGHAVHILTTYTASGQGITDTWRDLYTEKGISVTEAWAWAEQRGSVIAFPEHPAVSMSHTAYEWLAESPPDLVLFMDWQGHGFYAMQAKACGLNFHNTVFALVLHSPSLWHAVNNADFPKHFLEASVWQMERTCLEMADAVISPSQYMLDWCVQNGIRVPNLAFVQPNIFKQQQETKLYNSELVQEIVFFGRLEYRKGLEQFCNALDILAKKQAIPERVTFLGKCGWMGSEHPLLYIARKSSAWKGCQILLRLHDDHQQALEYLKTPGRLAVMPSVSDNSPYTVYECLQEGIPFLARRVGGIPELVRADWHGATLFGDNPWELAAKLTNALGKAAVQANLAFDPAHNKAAWIDGLPALVRLIRANEMRSNSSEQSIYISVCLTHYNRPALLRQAVDSLLAQDYPYFEVLLTDDGSTDKDALVFLDELEPLFLDKGWRILRLTNGYLGKARNTAAKEARGEYLLFMDDDNVAKPHMLSSFAKSIRTSKADLITCCFDVFSGTNAPTASTPVKEHFLPLGAAIAFGAFTNAIGDSNSLIMKACFDELGGFTEDYGLGHEDFELFLKAALHNKRILVIPEKLFWYRKIEDSMLSSTNAVANQMRSLRPFLEYGSPFIAELAVLAHGLSAELGYFSSSNTMSSQSKLTQLNTFGCDPQSKVTLSEIASLLKAQELPDLAEQVTISLREAAYLSFSGNRALHKRAQAAAADGRLSEIQDCLDVFASIKTESVEQDAFFTAILEALPIQQAFIPMRLQLIDSLRNIGDPNIVRLLTLSLHYVNADRVENAADCFLEAVSVASAQYLRTRPDVAEAIGKGNFRSALHHYILHGKQDRMVWPCEMLFSDIIKKNSTLSIVLSKRCSYRNSNDSWEFMQKVFVNESISAKTRSLFM